MIKILFFIVMYYALIMLVISVDALFKWLDRLDEAEAMERYVESLVDLLNS